MDCLVPMQSNENDSFQETCPFGDASRLSKRTLLLFPDFKKDKDRVRTDVGYTNMLVYPTSVRTRSISGYICWSIPSLHKGSFGETILGLLIWYQSRRFAPPWPSTSLFKLIEPPALRGGVSVSHIGANTIYKWLYMLEYPLSPQGLFWRDNLGAPHILTKTSSKSNAIFKSGNTFYKHLTLA
ncbi:hypothetical protein LXL04_035524 [Taraxacum kok-saghyz]